MPPEPQPREPGTPGPRFLRGDIWIVDFGIEPEDPEQAFARPAVIVSDNRLHHPNLNMVIVVPGTSSLRALSLHVVADPGDGTGLDVPTAFQTEQVRAVSAARLLRRTGRLGAVERHALDEVLRTVLDL